MTPATWILFAVILSVGGTATGAASWQVPTQSLAECQRVKKVLEDSFTSVRVLARCVEVRA